MTEAVKCIIEVTAGLVPGTPEPGFTKRWTVLSAEWDQAEASDEEADAGHAYFRYLLLAGKTAVAGEYARMLQDPTRFNWVRTDWVWL